MRLIACLILVLTMLSSASAIPPRFMPDEEMARLPIVVVARWDKTPLRGHTLVEGDVMKKLEGHTELVVERVIKGDVKPGKHKLLLGPFVGWEKDGGRVFSYTSTEMAGDAEDVAKANLWFLSPRRSRDEADKHVYLALENYRAVQPLQLEEYFRVLGIEDFKAELPKLLTAKEPLVVRRTLAMLTGGVLPWPYEPGWLGEFVGLKPRWRPLVEHAKAVEPVLNRQEPEVRRIATAVYAELAGKEANPRVRQLLEDDDAEVRGVASGILIRREDRESFDKIGQAMKGLKEPDLACKLMALIAEREEQALVPAAIAFLQTDTYGARRGDDIHIPAFKAQAALKKLTGHDFPFDVVASHKAWAEASKLEPAKRKAYLARALPYNPKPLSGRLVVDDKKFVAVITNASDKPLWLARIPDEYDLTWMNGGIGSGGFPDRQATGKESFVELPPGKSVRVPLDAERLDRGALTRLQLRYHHNGNQHGVNAWIGSVEVALEGSAK